MSYDPTGTRKFECCPYGDCYYCKQTNKTNFHTEPKEIRDVTIEVNVALAKATSDAIRIRANADTIPIPSIGDAKVLLHFISLVREDAAWDIKEEVPWIKTIGTEYPGKHTPIIYNGMQMTAENLGNYTYGYLGCFYRYSLSTLYGGSYFAAHCPTSGDKLKNEIGPDWHYIALGYYDALPII